MKMVLLFFPIIFLSCGATNKLVKIKEVSVFNSFAHGGSTIGLKSNIKNNEYADTSVNKSIYIKKDELELLMNNAKRKKHFQQKIAGITFAGKFSQNSTTHYFIYLERVKGIIDLTNMTTYMLKDGLKYYKL